MFSDCVRPVVDHLPSEARGAGCISPLVFLHAVLNSCRVGGAVSVASMCCLTVVSESCDIFSFSGACVFLNSFQYDVL